MPTTGHQGRVIPGRVDWQSGQCETRVAPEGTRPLLVHVTLHVGNGSEEAFRDERESTLLHHKQLTKGVGPVKLLLKTIQSILQHIQNYLQLTNKSFQAVQNKRSYKRDTIARVLHFRLE